MRPQVEEWQEDGCEGAEIVLIAHGIVARAIKEATTDLRKQGYKVGWFRPITIRPMPSTQLRKVIHNCKQALVVESAMGQFTSLIKNDVYGETTPLHTLLRPGVGITKDEVVDEVKKILKSPAMAK
jgi:2-oxoglutarate ferredoxin oxidoreductase subunit alpha